MSRQAAFSYASTALFGWLVFGLAGAPIAGGVCAFLALGLFIWGLARGAGESATAPSALHASEPVDEQLSSSVPGYLRGTDEGGPVSVFVPANADSGMVRARAQKALLAVGRKEDAETDLRETEPLRSDLSALVAATRSWVDVIDASAPVESNNSELASTAPINALPQPVAGTRRAQAELRPSPQAGASYALSRSEIANGLRELKALFDEGLLTSQEYGVKRQNLADQL